MICQSCVGPVSDMFVRLNAAARVTRTSLQTPLMVLMLAVDAGRRRLRA